MSSKDKHWFKSDQVQQRYTGHTWVTGYWTDKDSLLEKLKRWENDEDCTPETEPERGMEQMFRDVEFLPEMLKPDKAVYELLGVTFEEVVVYSTTAGCWV